MPLAEVISLYEHNASDVAAMLRKAADEIDAEGVEDDRTKAVVSVRVTEAGKLYVYGWGKTDILDSIGCLQTGATYLANTLFYAQDAPS